MGSLVFINVARRERDLSMQEAWDTYVAAQEQAKRSGRIEDGIAAGKAWRRWLEMFTGGRR